MPPPPSLILNVVNIIEVLKTFLKIFLIFETTVRWHATVRNKTGSPVEKFALELTPYLHLVQYHYHKIGTDTTHLPSPGSCWTWNSMCVCASIQQLFNNSSSSVAVLWTPRSYYETMSYSSWLSPLTSPAVYKRALLTYLWFPIVLRISPAAFGGISVF